jgi:CII-binding regulator of phage lambda lysogenization HflD
MDEATLYTVQDNKKAVAELRTKTELLEEQLKALADRQGRDFLRYTEVANALDRRVRKVQGILVSFGEKFRSLGKVLKALEDNEVREGE